MDKYNLSKLQSLAELKASAALVLADYLNEQTLYSEGIITQQEWIGYQNNILSRLEFLPDDPGEDDDIEKNIVNATVFLSYNHGDIETARTIVAKFKVYGVEVRMDENTVKPGQNIRDYIAQQVRETDASILLVSRKSLQSVWVSYETALFIYNELLTDKKTLLIALDKEYENNGFFDHVDDGFDKKLKDNQDKITWCQIKGTDPMLYEDERRMLSSAKNQFTHILQKLRGHHVAMLDEDNIDGLIAGIAHQLLKNKKH